MASALFSPITLRGLTLPNRVVVSPMCQYNSTDGSANDWHLMHLGNFSLGAAALVMTEMTNVNAVGRITHKCAGLYSDDNEKALKRVIDFCKQYGIAKQGLQIGHAGRKGSTAPPAIGGKPLKRRKTPGNARAVGDPLRRRLARAEGDDQRRIEQHPRRLRRYCAPRRTHRLRPHRDARRRTAI